jgi:hypothetical protein
MGRTLVVEIPENVYQPLAETAKQSGRTPEDLASEWLRLAIQSATDDPIENFIGAFSSQVIDWADQHDKYIGQALAEHPHSAEET